MWETTRREKKKDERNQYDMVVMPSSPLLVKQKSNMEQESDIVDSPFDDQITHLSENTSRRRAALPWERKFQNSKNNSFAIDPDHAVLYYKHNVHHHHHQQQQHTAVRPV